MKKYIRLAEYDEEFLITRDDYNNYVVNLQDAGYDNESVIVGESDNIQDLCDLFITKSKEPGNDFLDFTKDYKSFMCFGSQEELYDKIGCIIYYNDDNKLIVKTVAVAVKNEMKLLHESD